MFNLVFTKIHSVPLIRLLISVSVTNTVIKFSLIMWQLTTNKTIIKKHYTNFNYLIKLPNYIKQLLKVFSSYIHPLQYLPLLFTKDNTLISSQLKSTLQNSTIIGTIILH